MTIASTTRKAGPFSGNDVTTLFPFTFAVFSNSDVLAVLADTALATETTLALTTDYTVALNPDQDSAPGGTLTLSAPLATGKMLTLTSAVPMTQGVNLANQGGFYPDIINTALDRLTVLIQQVAEDVARAVKTQISSTVDPDDLIAQLVADAASAAADSVAASASAAAASASAAIIDGFENVGSWATGTLYHKNNLVRDGGSTYIVVADPSYTSGASVAADIGAGRIVAFAQKGDPGVGSGDMLASNNLSELTSTASTARANIGVNYSTTSAAGLVELATSAEAQAGTDAVRAMTPSTMSASCIGRDQTPTDVTASRAISPSAGPYSEYTNTTGRPILVNVVVDVAYGQGCDVYVDGIWAGSMYQSINLAGAIRMTTSYIIKNGGKYAMVAGSGSPSLFRAIEFK